MDRVSELNRGLEIIKSKASNLLHERGSLRLATSKVIEKVESLLFPQPTRTLNSKHDWIRAEGLMLGYGVGMFGSIGLAALAKEAGVPMNFWSFMPTFAASTFLGGSIGYRLGLRIP